jgi:YidC/Oxa1 family membrane protein insertase
MLQQRALAPELGDLRKKYKGDPQKLNQATMELYRERGINPLSSMSGCLPSLIQLPILSALYWVFRDARLNSHVTDDHFLFIPHLNAFPSEFPLIHGLPIPIPVYLILPILAAVTTFIQSRMMQQPKNPVASEQEQSTATMMKSMQYLMPAMILVFSLQVPAGLALYWFVSNCIAIGQQYRVNGWGGLRPKEQAAAFEKALQEAGYGTGPRSSASGDKIVAKRSSADRGLSVPATSGAGAGTVSGSGTGSRNQNQGGGNGTKNTARSNGGGGAASTRSNGKGAARPPVTAQSGGQRARSQPAGANRRASSKRTRKPK